MKQCEAVRVLQREWKPSNCIEQVGERKYYALISNKCLKSDKALSYALKPPEELLRLMKYDDEIQVGIKVCAKTMYKNDICRSLYYSASKQNHITSRASYNSRLNKQFKKPNRL